MQEDEFGWGSWSLKPEEMWKLNEARYWHTQFHSLDNHPEFYLEGIDALGQLPIQKNEDAKSKAYKFLKVWGHVRLIHTQWEEMVKHVDEHAYLIKLLRHDWKLDDDLSRNISYDNHTRPVARWMQILLERVSRTSLGNQMVSSTKLLHAAVPRLFVMLDDKISMKFFGTKPTSTVYFGLFLPLAQAQARWLSDHDVEPDPEQVCGSREPLWPKLVDEINWAWSNKE
jgi:hypothetical protein